MFDKLNRCFGAPTAGTNTLFKDDIALLDLRAHPAHQPAVALRRHSDRRPSCHASTNLPTCPAFEVSSKRRKGYPSETNVKRGFRFVHGDIELLEKLGRNDPCPCGAGRRFQGVLSGRRPVSMALSGMIIIGERELGRSASQK